MVVEHPGDVATFVVGEPSATPKKQGERLPRLDLVSVEAMAPGSCRSLGSGERVELSEHLLERLANLCDEELLLPTDPVTTREEIHWMCDSKGTTDVDRITRRVDAAFGRETNSAPGLVGEHEEPEHRRHDGMADEAGEVAVGERVLPHQCGLERGTDPLHLAVECGLAGTQLRDARRLPKCRRDRLERFVSSSHRQGRHALVVDRQRDGDVALGHLQCTAGEVGGFCSLHGPHETLGIGEAGGAGEILDADPHGQALARLALTAELRRASLELSEGGVAAKQRRFTLDGVLGHR